MDQLDSNLTLVEESIIGERWTRKRIIMLTIIFHVFGLLIYILDFYLFKIYITNYNDGLIPDQQMFIIRGKSVLSGNLPYENLEIYESLAPPLSMYYLAFPILFEKLIPIPFHILYRIYFSIFNIISTWILLKIGKIVFSQNKSNYVGILFGLNPYVISQAAISGSDECLGAFLMVLVTYSIVKNHNLLTIVLIGIGTSVKYYPILLIPYFLSTKSKIRDKVYLGFLASLSVLLFFLPFYFVNPSNFMAQFNNRLQDLPWNSEGNSGIIILIARMEVVNMAKYSNMFRIGWMSVLVLLGIFQIFFMKSDIEFSSLIPSVFFVIYPKFFFSYFLIIFPLILLSLVNLRHLSMNYFLINLGLIVGGMVNDRVFGYGSVYRQEPSGVPILMILGIGFFYVVWIFILIVPFRFKN